jgi:beta-1,4-mannosyltransferase
VRVLFAPDWRRGVPYQRLLAEALAELGVEIDWLSEYRRVFPLWRSLPHHPCDIFHLHWPEAYYARMGDVFDAFRRVRFRLDLRMATRGRPLVLTAHNLRAHNRGHEAFAAENARAPMQRAAAVIAHSAAAKAALVVEAGLEPSRIHVIPLGDLSVVLGLPAERADARRALRLGQEKICLMFGSVEPYKGIEEAVDLWANVSMGATLAIVGKPPTEGYARALRERATGVASILLRFEWLSDEDLRLWLSAADCVLFNYRAILSSGAAGLARSWGVPLLFPARLTTCDLGEPSPSVFRFVPADLAAKLQEALEVSPSYDAAEPWRAVCSWPLVAKKTAQLYRSVLEEHR